LAADLLTNGQADIMIVIQSCQPARYEGMCSSALVVPAQARIQVKPQLENGCRHSPSWTKMMIGLSFKYSEEMVG
jgi:hypothetical protein